MGCCASSGKDDEQHLELSDSVNDAVTCKCGAKGNSVQVSKANGRFLINGSGTALGSCPLDGDTSTWQVKFGNLPSNTKVGVKRFNKKSVGSLEGGLEDDESTSWFLKDVEIKEGDVVGIYWDQTDLPMLSFSLNGNLLMNSSIMRIRPANEIYPAFSVSGGSSCEVIFDADHFEHAPISSKFNMIICSTSLI